jgi:hypothetical protein
VLVIGRRLDMNLTPRVFILTTLAIVLAINYSADKASAQYEYGTLLLNDYNSSNNKCSFDFSTKSYGSVSDGEFYFTAGKLWANNVGQRGVIDLGPIQFDPKTTNISSSGFNRFGVVAKPGDVYLSQARAGRENRYILLRINYLSPISNGKLMGLEYYILETGRIIARTNETGGFSIYGPRSFSSKSKGLHLERALTGEYTIVFDDIPGLVTPLSQTKSLGTGKTIVFEGVYQ